MKLKTAITLMLSCMLTGYAFAQNYSGGAGTSDNPYQIANKADLKYLSENSGEWSKHFIQTADITFTSADFQSGGDFYNGGAGWKPIGELHDNPDFTGSYDGDGHTISNLYIRLYNWNIGLFGYISSGARIENLGLVNVDIIGRGNVGAIAGYSYGGKIIKCYSSGSVIATVRQVGGLLGDSGYYSRVENSYSTASVEGRDTDSRAGGLVGYHSNTCTILNSFSAGTVSGINNTGGLIGLNLTGATIINSFWDTQTSGKSSSGGGTGKTTAEMRWINTFTGWDIVEVMSDSYAGYPYPGLRMAESGTIWQIFKTYAVTYNANGATGGTAPTTQIKLPNITLTLASNTGNLVQTGHTFYGWNTQANGLGTSYAEGAEYTANETLGLFAKWTANTYNVIFKSNGGTGDDYTQSITFDQSENLTANTFTRTGYSFAGWNTQANGNGTQYANEAAFTMNVEGQTLFAQWTANTYNVTFKSNGGTGDDYTQSITFAQSKNLSANTFTRTGYRFSGWNTQADGEGTPYANEAIFTMNVEGRELFAQWEESPMILIFNANLSDGTTITLPLYGAVDVTVDWGDASTPEAFNTTGDQTYTYASNGEYTVTINGALTQFGKGDNYDNADRLTSVTSFGNIGLTSLDGAFMGATNLTSVPDIIPTTVTNMSSMFRGASAFNQDISGWDVSSVTAMNNMFNGASSFNQNISGWDVSNVTGMRGMFRNASAFNQNISGWDVSSVTDMRQMFLDANTFNQPLNAWGSKTSKVTNMVEMFNGASSFNQNISGWDVSSVTNMINMFQNITLSIANYDALLNGWSRQTVQSNVTFHGGNSKYSPIGESARNTLTSGNSWDITDGGLEHLFSGGDGTEGTPYQIANLNDLQYFSENSFYWGKHFIQTADIDAVATSTWNDNGSGGYFGFSPIGNNATNFTGSYNGNEKTISNLFINREATDDIGFFGILNGANITDLTLAGIDFTGNHRVGGLTGQDEGSTTISGCTINGTNTIDGVTNVGGFIGLSNTSGNISDCHFSGTITANNPNDNLVSGGFAGVKGGSGTISECSVSGTINGNGRNHGGFVGWMDNGQIRRCYSTMAVVNTSTTQGRIGGFVGGHAYYGGTSGQIHNCYAAGNVTANSTTSNTGIGGFVGAYYAVADNKIYNSYSTGAVSATTASSNVGGFSGKSDFGSGGANNCFWDLTTSEQPTSAEGGVGEAGKTTAEMKTQSTFTNASWDFTNVWSIAPAKNDGYPYLQWQSFPPSTYPVTYNANEAADGSVPDGQTKIEDVVLTLALNIGNLVRTGYTFEGWNTQANGLGTDYAEGAEYTANEAVELFAKWIEVEIAVAPETGNGESDNPYQIATWQNLYWISKNSDKWNKHYIQTADIDFADADPAITTWNGGTGFKPIGVDHTNPFTGSYNGNNKTINGLFVNSTGYAGLFGRVNSGSSVKDLNLTNANIASLNNFAGGIVGQMFGSISNCSVTGSVIGHSSTGGLVGSLQGLIENSDSSATVESTNSSAGGLVGDNYGTIEKSFSTGNVTGNTAGGLIGYWQSGNISESYSKGDVSGNYGVGGLIGAISEWNSSTVSDSYSTGNVTRKSGQASSLIGAFCGDATKNDNLTDYYISRCYSAGNVFYEDAANPADNGFAVESGYGMWGPTYANNFWDSQASNQSTGTGATAKNTLQMKTQATFTGWDFTTVWQIVGANYPTLINNPEGEVAEPATQATNISFSNVFATQMDLNWTNGDGASRVVFAKQASSGTTTPLDGTTYTANAQFGSGTEIASGWYCIYNGTGSSVTVTGLSANTDYIFQVFEYNGNAEGENYLSSTASDNPKYQATSSVPLPNYALNFDGANDYANLGHTAKPTAALTIEMWVNPQTWSHSSAKKLISNTEFGGYAIELGSVANKIKTWIHINGSYRNIEYTVSALSGWHHVALTFDGRYSYLYIDGIQRGSHDMGSSGYTITHHASNSTLIGAEPGAGSTPTGHYFQGDIDEVRIWNIARSVADIRANMCKNLIGNESGLMAYYKMSDGEGTTLSDNSSNSNNGTLNNMNNSDWVISGAAIGDVSIADYNSPSSVNLASPDGDDVTVSALTGSPSGVQIYRIDSAPNVTTAPGNMTQLSTNHYFGVFIAGGTSPTYTLTYNYDGYRGISNESSLDLAYRDNNSITSWTEGNATLDQGANTLTLLNQNGTEYILGLGVNTYSVTYNANEASGGAIPDPQEKEHDIALTLATNSGNLVRTGYAFAGWNTQADGLGDAYAAGASYTANVAVELFAKWLVLAPNVGPVTIDRTAGQILKVPDLVLLANSSDPEGSALSIVWVSPASTNGGTVALSGRWITYTPPDGDDAPDSFSFRVQNAFGGQAEAQAAVQLPEPADDEQTLNISSITPSGSDILVRFIGIPGRSYNVQATTNLVSPDWLTIGSCEMGSQGFVIFTDVNPPASRFYRTVKP